MPRTLKSTARPGNFAIIGCLILLSLAGGFPPSTAQQKEGAVVRLRVRVKDGDATKGLSRKRFFLIKGSVEQNKSVVDAITNQALTTRDCYYTRAGATPQLINWLQTNDCESVYCRELQNDDVQGPKAVPEFATAFGLGEQEFGNRDLARKWITVNVPDKLRDGFYKQQQSNIAAIINQAQTSSGAPVQSVMTDTKGTAYFTGLEAGNYTLTNAVGTEIGATISIWNCDVQIRPDDLGNEKAFLISNRKDKNVKCVALEKPAPPCAP